MNTTFTIKPQNVVRKLSEPTLRRFKIIMITMSILPDYAFILIYRPDFIKELYTLYIIL